MNELVPHNDKLEKARRAALSDFKPEETFEVTSVLKSAAEHAARMRDWEACWTAVDWLVQRIAKHVAWWNANVSVRHASGTKKIAGLRSSLTAEKAAAETGISPQTISRWKVGTARPDFRERIFNRCHRQAFSDTEKRADKQTGEMEWYTPDIYIDAARAVLGDIDLDPASCERAQFTIRAGKYFDARQNGLKQKWFGRVWLNPPYAGGLVAAFADKMIQSWNAGDLTAAIMLTNAYTETSWWHGLAKTSHAVCFTRGRIRFESPHGEKCVPTNGQSFIYFGKEVSEFHAVFEQFGVVMVKP